jgi:hypothetical protein
LSGARKAARDGRDPPADLQRKEQLPMRRYRRLLALPAAALATAILATSALAVPPVHIIHEIDDGRVIPISACGFPIVEHVEGTVRETIFFDSDGAPIRAMNSFVGFKVTWTNTESGATAWTVQSATQHLTWSDDGPASLVITGVQGRVRSPDGGFVADIGRLVLSIPSAGPAEIVEFDGRSDGQGGPLPELCHALAS